MLQLPQKMNVPSVLTTGDFLKPINGDGSRVNLLPFLLLRDNCPLLPVMSSVMQMVTASILYIFLNYFRLFQADR